ncbi:ArsR family transcriptional regulator [Nitrosopumilus ureiphilus]|uniref:HTH arsR-type domain-containing protein n=1 Tax=Nitrosopumilus ureiphilus TaxID=1470067 RepID=A0A7D5R6V2_9ARCH|nr:ArsR family transcriptional regulator [Nitrosopumilus ureiphilus]QLH06778.1 hypothetical protein C5F50_06580 [Nitrosopumilus ureiphilus]
MNTDKKITDRQTHAEYTKNRVQIFPTDDDRLKLLGEIFSNESSRKILTLLLERELTIMNISKVSGLSPNLVIHHLKKMIDSDIVIITKESKNSRGRPLRSYRAKPAIVILSKDAANRAIKSKSLQHILGKITRFASVVLAGVFTWILASSSNHTLDSAFKYPRPTLPPYMTPIEPQSGDFVFAVVMTASVIVAGLVIPYIIKQIRK